ncbi:hypothetical protein A7982_13818 [Minicystis rosea]|nr:hypothetical protein A7982_13818 [Minicystis rosea]
MRRAPPSPEGRRRARATRAVVLGGDVGRLLLTNAARRASSLGGSSIMHAPAKGSAGAQAKNATRTASSERVRSPHVAAGGENALGREPMAEPVTWQGRVLGLQRALGNQATQELLDLSGGAPIQAKAQHGVAPGRGPAAGMANATGIPTPVRAKMEAAFGADFSSVRVYPRSSHAAALGALAYTQGEHVHFAPGQFRPESSAGQALLGHELVHVVQQRAGRVAATRQLKPAVWINDSSHLEREADTLGRRAARGETGLVSASRASTAGRGVIQGAFTAHAVLEDKSHSTDSASVVQIRDIKMSKGKRPPTKLEPDQGSHILAWEVKVREWEKLFAGTADTVLDNLVKEAKADQAYDENTASQQARANLIAQAESLKASPRSTSDWNRYVSYLVTQYIKLYQKSSFTVYGSEVSKTPKGHGEAGALRKLEAWDAGSSAANISDSAAQEAIKLLDIQAALAEPIKYKGIKDWAAALKRLFPNLFLNGALRAPSAGELADLAKSYNKADLKKLLTTGTFSATAPFPGPITTSPQGMAALDATTVDESMESEPFLARVRAEPLASGAVLAASNVTVKSVALSDERPETQFFAGQASHTIAWSLERRAWRKMFGDGQPLDQVMNALLHTLNEDEQWAQAVAKAGNSDKARGDRVNLIQEVTSEVGSTNTQTEWTQKLNDWIERYVAIYQQSPFATFSEPTPDGGSTPLGHGEAHALAKLASWEKRTAQPTSDQEVADNALKLLDVGTWVTTAELIDLDRLGKRFLEDLEKAFPQVFAQYGAAIAKELGALKSAPRQPGIDLNAKRSSRAMKRGAGQPPSGASPSKAQKTGNG